MPPGRTARVKLFLLVVLVPTAARAQLHSEDFEDGGFSPNWSVVQGAASSWAIVAPAAHRGTGGLRIQDDNADGGTGTVLMLEDNFPDTAIPNFYLRYWARFGPTYAGELTLSQIISGSVNSIADLSFDDPLASMIGLQGYNAASTWITDSEAPLAPVAGWHLHEVATLGVGTAAGQRLFWLDGKLIGSQPIDWTGILLSAVKFGVCWSHPPTYTGTIDFDDLRTSYTPPASQLVLQLGSGTAAVGDCVAASVALLDSSGMPANAPYEVDVTMGAGQLPGAWAPNPTCTSSSAPYAIPSGASSAVFSFRPSGAGSDVLSATHPDFLGRGASLVVSGNSGTDGGSSGSPDGGPGSQGMTGTDGGPDALGNGPGGIWPLRDRVGCDCASVDAPSLGLLLLCLLRSSRRRRAD